MAFLAFVWKKFRVVNLGTICTELVVLRRCIKVATQIFVTLLLLRKAELNFGQQPTEGS